MAKSKKVWINVYEITRAYGGPEEGGWYYDEYNCILEPIRCHRHKINKVMKKLEKFLDEEGYKYEKVIIQVEDEPAKQEKRPRPIYC